MKKSIALFTLIVYLAAALSVAIPIASAVDNAAPDIPPVFYSYQKFSKNISGLSVSMQGATIEHCTDNGGRVHYCVDEGGTSKGYTDLTLSKDFCLENEYIFDVEVTPARITSGYIGFDSKQVVGGSSKFRSGARFDSDGKITMYNASSQQIEVGTWTPGKTVRMSMHYRISEGLVDFYLDGVCVKENITCSSSVNPNIFRIDAAKSSASGVLDFYIDNLRVYVASELLPAEGESKYITYASKSFTNFTSFKASSNQGGTIEYKELADGNGVAHFYVYDGESSGSYHDTTVPVVSGVDEYIIEATVTPNVISAGAIGLFDAKDGNGVWRIGTRFLPNGSITIRNKSGVDVTVGTWIAETPLKYSVRYNIPAGFCDVFINGELVASRIPCVNIRPHIFRIDLSKSSTSGNLDFYVDDIHLYSGHEIKDSSLFEDINASVMDLSMIPDVIGTAGVYTTDAKYYYQNGEKHVYQSELHRPTLIDNVPHISKTAAADIFEISDSDFNLAGDAVSINGEEYVSASAIANVLGKSYQYDERGFFILSDTEFPHKDSPHFISMFETIDLIYRYVNFDNPTGEKFLADFDAHVSHGEHPRILFNAEEFEYIKAQTSPEWTEARNYAVIQADASIANYNSSFAADCTDDRKQTQATNFQKVIENLATAYLITDNEYYAQKGVEYMKILAAWETLGFEVANLTTGHWAMGMAVGFDSFYNYMSQEDREFFKDAIKRLPFADTIRAYSGGGGVHWITIRDNFMGVIGGGVLSLALAVADEEDLREDAAFIAENVIKSLGIAVSLFYPNGGYFEGIGYSEYMIGNLCKSIESLFKCCGTDYGFEYAKGFTDAGHFLVYAQSSKYRLNFSDCDRYFSATYLPYWFGYRYGQTDTAKLWYHINTTRGANLGVYSSYFVDKGIGFEASHNNMPLDAYYPLIESGTFRSGFDTTTPTFAGFHGGWNGLTHDMLDLGQFIFESDGVLWALDLGGDNYSLPSYFGKDGYKVYRKNPEGENCVVINPTNNVDEEGNVVYYGQNTKAQALTTMYETAPGAAMAALDLTSAYERDVDSYIRGFYFGNERNTLQIQDEIKLKDTSELYWFMHTAETIEIIDSNTARLHSTSADLRVEVYCEGGDYELKVMEAVPLPTSPVVEGQAVNDGITKLAIHMPEASGDVQISVKLIPENGMYAETGVTSNKISEWTLPEGEIVYPLAIGDSTVTDYNAYIAEIQIPDNTSEIRLYIDDKYVSNADVPETRWGYTPEIDLTGWDNGSHIVKVEAIKNDGTTETASKRFNYTKKKATVVYENSLVNYTGESVTPQTGWTMHTAGTVEAPDGKDLTLVSSGTGAVWLDYRAKSNIYAIKNKITSIEFDVEFSSIIGHFEIECKSTTNWFLNDKRIFEKGIMLNGLPYVPGQKYHVNLTLDLTNQTAAVYIDGKLAKQYSDVSAAVDNTVYKLQYTGGASGDTVSFSNLQIMTYCTVNGDVDVVLSVLDNMATVKAASDSYADSVNIVIGYYTGNKLIKTDVFCNEQIPSDAECIQKNGSIPDSCEYIKAFVFANNGSVCPLGKLNYYRK